MRLPHHPEVLEALRAPTEEDPWRILVSACILGWKVAVDGTDYGLGVAQPEWLASPKVQAFPFCPEDATLGTPRTTPDLHGGDGFEVLDGEARVMDEKGVDLTEQVLKGSVGMLAVAKRHAVDFALLTDRSGSCGSQVISVGCRFEEPVDYRKGVGVAAAMLLRAGFHVVSQRDFATLERLHARVDPKHVPDPEARDHHRHPWVLEHLG